MLRSLSRISSRRLAAALFIASCAVAAAKDEESAPAFVAINDGEIRSRFVGGMEAIRNSGKNVSTGELLKQLKSRRRCDVPLPDSDPNPPILSAPQIYDHARRATLVLGHIYQCDKCDKWHPNLAGAVVIDPSGIAVTNYHVMDKPKAGAFGATTIDGKIFPVLEVLAASPEDDLAVVRLGGGPFESVPVSAGDPVGSEINVISHPNGGFYTFSKGAIARYYFDPKKKSDRLQITADYARGSSGCGVFNEAGELTGIVAATNSIYHTETDGHQKNLQMVVKSCIPVSSLRKLTTPPRKPGD